MRLAGHTMGTPGKTLEESMRLFHDLGFAGIEIRCAKDGQLDTERFRLEDAPAVRALAERSELEIVCLTPYFRDFIHEAKREAELASMRHVIDIASALRCPHVRAYGGLLPKRQEEYATYWERTVSGLRELGRYAAAKGVDICVETHGGSLTMSAADTARLVEEVGLENVGILFDWAWVSLAGKEGPREAVRIAGPYIKHVHVKDWIATGRQQPHTTLLGDGELEWPVVLGELASLGYDGYISDEYEKYWKAHLPEPEVGMKKDLQVLRGWLESVGVGRTA